MKNRITLIGLPHDSLWIKAVMHFPNDKHLRESWYAVEFAKGEISEMRDRDRIMLDKETLNRLVFAPSHDELKRHTIQAVKKGIVAGDILASIYLMERFDIPEPSIKKAVHVAQQFAKKTQYGDSTPMKRSRRMVRDAFNEYRSVAHLWAAFRLNQAYRYADDDKLFFEKLPFFLEVAAGLYAFGTTFKPYRARPRKPILPTNEMWKLPENILVRHLDSERFPNGICKLLRNYDANEYQ